MVSGPAQYGATALMLRCTKGDGKPAVSGRMRGAGLSLGRSGKAPPDRPAFQPHWGKPAVRNERGDRGNVGIIRSPVAPRSYPTAGFYGRRDETRLEHGRRLQAYLALRTPTRDDRRAALLAGIEAAEATDRGEPIVTALIEAFRRRAVLLPAAGEVERLALAARAIARRRANAALLRGMTDEQLAAIDGLLEVDATIGQTRFGWLRAAPEAPGDQNLLGLVERLAFVRALGLGPSWRDLIHPERFRQLAREGEVSPSWLVADFSPLRRRATIAAQVLELATTLTDAAVVMFMKLK